jgi:alpha-N-arabinofuranosidase
VTLSARITASPDRAVSPVPRRLFGSFVEHLGRCVYTGIYEPGHPTADGDGFRGDVLELTRELGATVIRYPGGNFVSGFRWEDSVGPAEERPARLDLAWHSTETNEFGLHEFMRWAAKANVEPMMAINLGTRGIEEALDLLDYANHAAGSAWSDLRRANGASEPFGIGLWCLGNEMDATWQVGHKSGTEYGRIAAETARAMRRFDPGLELVACGSSSSQMPTFGSWEHDVLTESQDVVDFISLHAYYYQREDDLASFLASAEDMDRFIASVVSTADAVTAAAKSDKTIMLSFDEWNVWYQRGESSVPPSGTDWPVAPELLEDRYNVADAVVVGSLLISLLRHSDRVAIACQAQLVNVIAPIMTEPGGVAWKQTIFHPFALTAKYARGDVLAVEIEGDRTPTDVYGSVAAVDCVATWDEESGELAYFLVNRSPSEAAEVSLTTERLDAVILRECVTLANDDPYLVNTVDLDLAKPSPNTTARVDGGSVSITLPATSWTMLRVGRPE